MRVCVHCWPQYCMLWLWLKELLLNNAGDHSCPDRFAALSQGEPLALLQGNATNETQE